MQWTTNAQFAAPAAAAGVSVTPANSAWTNSAWVTVLDPLPADCVLTSVIIETYGTTNHFELDIGLGGAGSEVVKTTLAGWCGDTSFNGPGAIRLPLPLDGLTSGGRLAIRMRKPGTSVTAWVFSATYLQKPIVGDLQVSSQPMKCSAPAAVATTLPTNTTSWANGTYATLIASTAAALVIVGAVIPVTGTDYEIDIAVGAAASEVVITTLRGFDGTSLAGGPCWLPFESPLDNIATGVRVAGRWRKSGTGAGTGLLKLVYLEKPL